MRGSEWIVGRRAATCGVVLAVLSLGACSGSEPAVPVPQGEEPMAERTIRGAHERVDNPQDTYVDERGLRVEGLGIDFPARVYPASADFPSGPEVGERLPEFTLPNQHGESVDFHADRAGQQAVVVFYRSATLLPNAAGRAAGADR